MSRYTQAEVDESIAQAERGVFTPHAQIVLADRCAELSAENQRLREEVNEFNMNSAAEQMQIVGLADQLTELRAATSALVEHIDRKYYDTVAPSQAAIERHAELGRLAIGVLAKLQPSAAEVERG